jgi:signal peptidase I
VGDLVVGARSGREEPEGQDSSVNDATGENDVSADDKYGSTEPGASGGSGDPGDPPAGAEGKDGQPAKKPRSFWKELPILVLIALILAMLIKSFLLQAFSIPSASMQNTLQEGDRVLVDKLTPWFGSEPVRGEVVVFHDPGGWLSDEPTASPNVVQRVLSFIGLMPSAEEKDLIKRVIAVGGDTVECKRGGKVKVNGVALDESSYLYPGNTPCDDMPFGPLKVPRATSGSSATTARTHGTRATTRRAVATERFR